jgi:hypothetical protein
VVCGNASIYGSVTIGFGGNYWHSPSTGFTGSLAVYGHEHVGTTVCSGPGQSTSSGCGGNSASSVNATQNGSVRMCFNGTTYCVDFDDVAERLTCGYTLGGCQEQQTAACNNVPSPNNGVSSCNCTATIETLTLRYIGPFNQLIEASAKKNCIPINNFSATNTGDLITVDASDGGLLFLRKHTFLTLPGLGGVKVKIPTNCCDISVGKTYFPFEVVSWTDTDGNSCNSSQVSLRTISDPAVETVEAFDGAVVSQYPNPAENLSNFEFTVPNDDNVTFSIVDVRGQLIKTIFDGQAQAEMLNKFTMDVSEMVSGMYFIYLNTSEGVFKKKFIIIK